MPNYTDPRFLGGAVGLIFGGVRVLGARPSTLAGFKFNNRVSIQDTVAMQNALNATASTEDILAYQMRNPDQAVTVAYGINDPRRTALLYRPGYIEMIQRSLAANAPLSGGDAEQIAGSGVDLSSGLAPLAVIDRINALDESWGPALESYRRTFQIPQSTTNTRQKYTKSDAAGWNWRNTTSTKFLRFDEIKAAVARGPVTWLDGANKPLSPAPPPPQDLINPPANALYVEITEPTPITTEFYSARLAAVRATTEALIWGRDVLRPFMAVILDDSTGTLTPGWMSYLATYQVTREDVEAMARQIAQSQQPRASAWDSFLQTMGAAVSLLMGGVDFVANVGTYAQNVSNAPAIDWQAAGREAGNLANQALAVYGAGVRLTGTEAAGIEGAQVVSAPLAPEEARLLNWLSKSPPWIPLSFPCQHRNQGSAIPVSGTLNGSFLRGLGGGGISARAFFDRLGSTQRFEEAVRAGGTLQGSASLLSTPGAVSLKCLLLARRWPLVLGGQFAQVLTPIHGVLPLAV